MADFRQSKPHIVLLDSPEDLASRALTLFVDAAERAIRSRGRFFVAISGGRTPAVFFELLVEAEASKQLQWDCVEIFWVDERCVRPDDRDSNYRLADELFLSRVPLNPENIHRIPAELSDPELAAAKYSEMICDAFGIADGSAAVFDLIVLGMGTDAHIASLFPGFETINETDKLAAAVRLPDPGLDRVTLTKPVITAAEHIVILISGSDKARTLSAVLKSGPDEHKYPVHILWPVLDKVTWLVDNEAGRFIAP